MAAITQYAAYCKHTDHSGTSIVLAVGANAGTAVENHGAHTGANLATAQISAEARNLATEDDDQFIARIQADHQSDFV